MRTIPLKPIKNSESVDVGIAEFENKILEYTEAGGRGFDQDDDKKRDLLAILPKELREQLFWQASDAGSYAKFRDMIKAQNAKILFNRARLPLHNLEDDRLEEENEVKYDLNTMEGLVAAVLRAAGGGSNFRRTQGPTRAPATSAAAPGARPPRKCPNCDDEHGLAQCPKPAVAVEDRRCWTCKEKGHSANRCPTKSRQQSQRRGGRPVRLIDEGEIPIFGLNVIDHEDAEGFQPVKRGARPMPRGATLGDFVRPKKSQNRFSCRKDNETSEKPSCGNRLGPTAYVTPVRLPQLAPSPARPGNAQNVANGQKDTAFDMKKLQDVMDRERDLIKDLHEIPALPRLEILEGILHDEGIQLGILEHDEGEEETIAEVQEEIKVAVAVDSGAVAPQSPIGVAAVPTFRPVQRGAALRTFQCGAAFFWRTAALVQEAFPYQSSPIGSRFQVCSMWQAWPLCQNLHQST